MRAGDFLAALDALPLVNFDVLTGSGGFVVVAPHPDDESLGCGGLIAEACRRGCPVRLVVLSNGCGSHPNSRMFPPERLRALREDETVSAVSELGLTREHVRFLRLPDAHVPSTGEGAETAAAAIAEAVRACGAGAVFTTWRHDPHCDHQAASAIVDLAQLRLDAVRVYAFSVWGHALPPETEVGPPPSGCRLDIAAHREAKRRAIAAHASQTTGLVADDTAGFRLPQEMIARACGRYEAFIEVSA